MRRERPQFLPITQREVDRLGWDYIDIILYTGDAYIDHPSFGTAVIGRYLESLGYRVAIVPQPNWQDDLREFRKFDPPRLFFGVTSGVMDSMVNHYTAAKRRRSNDAYTAGGERGARPDYATTLYSKILKELYPDSLVVLGGVEASLRRVTHYDYWQDKLLPSILFDSKADLLVYGMGERPIGEIAKIVAEGGGMEQLKRVKQVSYLNDSPYEGVGRHIELRSYEEQLKESDSFVKNFATIERESNLWNPAALSEPAKGRYVVINPPFGPEEDGAIDGYYNLPYTRLPHFKYRDRQISAYEMIKDSITTHRGCFGSCAFCTIAAHQGKFINSRSQESIMEEVKRVASQENFRGTITDLGGPTANMYKMKGKDIELCKECKRISCIYPTICKNLEHSHATLLSLYREARRVEGVKNCFVSSGIRYDLFLDEKGYHNKEGKSYLEELILHHTSGRLKVAPEHTEEDVLKAMGKPTFAQFAFLKREFDLITRANKKRYQLIPYFISAHPGCGMEEMRRLASNPHLRGLRLEQVQDFTPTPMTRSAAMFYSGVDPISGKKLYIEREIEKKQRQKSYFLRK